MCGLALKVASWTGLWGPKRELGAAPAPTRAPKKSDTFLGISKPRVGRGLAGGRAARGPPKIKLKLKM